MAAATTVVEALPPVRSRRRHKQSRKPRAVLLRCHGREPYRLIFQLGINLGLYLAALGVC